MHDKELVANKQSLHDNGCAIRYFDITVMKEDTTTICICYQFNHVSSWLRII